MKRLPVIFGITALVLLSCDFSISVDDGGGKNQSRKFWAQNLETEDFYQLTADLLATGDYCNVWAESGRNVSASTARAMADAYDKNIYPKMIDNFSMQNFTFEGYTFRNTMEAADALIDGDGKLTILLLDIKDGYSPGGSYVAGYFSFLNFFDYDSREPMTQYSNRCDMIYVDTYPGEPGSPESNQTVAHEMQHLMNFVSSVVCRLDKGSISLMDTWIDEGLSSAAEWVYAGKHPEIRWKWYNQNGNGADMKGDINKGNNFFVWGGQRVKDNKDAILDDYATVYLFFQWLRLQSGSGTGIYKNIIQSKDWDYNAVTSAAKSIDSTYDNNWGGLLRDWMAANWINASSGRYGYLNDSTLKQVKAPYAPTTPTTISLYPGEGVYSRTDKSESLPSTGAPTIKYAGLSSTGTNNSSTSNPGALLTYNASMKQYDSKGRELDATPTTGSTTGLASVSAPSLNMVPGSQSAKSALSGPYPISAGDMLRRNGHGELPVPDMAKLNKGFAIDE